MKTIQPNGNKFILRSNFIFEANDLPDALNKLSSYFYQSANLEVDNGFIEYGTVNVMPFTVQDFYEGDSGGTMMQNSEIFRRAHALINDGAGWAQGFSARGNGTPVDWHHFSANRFSVYGAIMKIATQETEFNPNIRTLLQCFIDASNMKVPITATEYERITAIQTWNDTKERTVMDVMSALDRAATLAELREPKEA